MRSETARDQLLTAVAAPTAPAVASLRLVARTAGALYLLNTLTILLAVFCFRGIIVLGDPTTTAANVLAHEPLFRLGFACELISTGCSIAVAALLYELFKSVNRSVSLLAAFFRLVACAIAAFGYLFQLAPLHILGRVHGFGVLKLEELQGLALLLYSFAAQASHISIVFFGFHFILLAYLLFRSRFLPVMLAVLVACAGLGGLTFLVPPLASHLMTYFVILGLLGEVSLSVWLLVKGVDVQKWQERARLV